MASMKNRTLVVVCFLAYWLLPDYRHPVRYALREAGIEPFAGASHKG